MKSIHDTNLAGIALTVALVCAAVFGVGMLGAAAISFEGDSPDSAQVNSEVEIEEVVVEDLATVGDTWTMQVTTELDSPRIQATVKDPGGNPTAEYDTTDDTLEFEIDTSRDATVELSVTGDAPPIQNGPGQFSYENQERENIVALRVSELFQGEQQSIDGGTFSVHRYTDGSQEARAAIDDANEAAEDADSDDARDAVDDAVTFYNNAEFDKAIERANEAEDIAGSEGETRRLLMIIGGILALIIVIGGGAYLYQERQEPENKLR